MKSKAIYSEGGERSIVEEKQAGLKLKFRYERILDKVRKSGYKTNQFCVMIGLSATSMNKTAKGEVELGLLKFLKICEVLKVSPMYFIEDTGDVLPNGDANSDAMSDLLEENHLLIKQIESFRIQLLEANSAKPLLVEKLEAEIRERDTRIELLEFKLKAEQDKNAKRFGYNLAAEPD